jgi:hypothetical protein
MLMLVLLLLLLLLTGRWQAKGAAWHTPPFALATQLGSCLRWTADQRAA